MNALLRSAAIGASVVHSAGFWRRFAPTETRPQLFPGLHIIVLFGGPDPPIIAGGAH